MNTFSLRTTAWLGFMVVSAGLLGMTGCSSSNSTSSPSSRPSSGSAGASASPDTLAVNQIVHAATLKHSFKPEGKGTAMTESLTQPDDIVALDGNLYVGFQNGVGSQARRVLPATWTAPSPSSRLLVPS